MRRLIAPLVLAVPLLAFANHNRGHVDVDVGPLSPRAVAGQARFNEICAACHGVNGQGTVTGPPLIHTYYNPGHHNNAAFTRAVLKGVKQHHWTYGDMPAQSQIGFSDMANITKFVREVQEQNGIVTKPHKMR